MGMLIPHQIKGYGLIPIFFLATWFFLGFSTFAQTTDLLFRANDEVRGDPNAPVTLLEYSDFTCGYCEKFFHETFPRLLTRYIDTGKVRFVYRDFPRSPSGPALHSAMAARCAGDQNAYWPMHDRLFNSGRKFDLFTLQEIAKDLDLDMDQFNECLETQPHLEDIYQDRIEGGQLGVRGTPGFILFLTDTSKGSEALFIPGAFPFEVFEEEIEKMLKKAQQNGSQSSSPSSPQVEGL